MIREEYLGDGVYASFDGFAIMLRAPREHGDHFIVLEPREFEALMNYAKRAKPCEHEWYRPDWMTVAWEKCRGCGVVRRKP